MATNTYVELKKETVATPVSSVVLSSIDQTYTNLFLVVNGSTSSSGTSLLVKFNSDSTNIYSDTGLYGQGSSAVSYRAVNNAVIGAGEFYNYNTTTTINIQNYSSTAIEKVLIGRANSASNYVQTFVGLRRDTSAINSITLSVTGNNFTTGTTFSLYGIRAEGVSPAPKATGGAIYSDSLYYYHVFGSTGVFTPSQALSCDVLTVAGGGGGGAYGGGGGGAGGYRLLTTQSLANGTNYTATVGAGGNAGVYNSSQAVNGSNSSFAGSGFSTITASGGGYGGGYPTGTQSGGSGGSGGGSWVVTGASGNAGGYSPVEGFAGGNGAAGGSFNETSGGGGGAGGVGQNATGGSRGGDGGVGNSATFSTWGLATGVGQNVSGTYYIAGGGGAGQPGNITAGAQAVGGFGGGGTGSTKSGLPSTAGSANTGSGGGAGSYSGTPGTIYTASNGGSGVVIVRYLKA